LGQLHDDLKPTYLRWLTASPYLHHAGDDAGYVRFTEQLLLWLSRHLDPATQDPSVRTHALNVTKNLDLGQLLLVDAPVRGTLEARNQVLEQLALRDGPPPRVHPRPGNLSQGRIRIGIIRMIVAKSCLPMIWTYFYTPMRQHSASAGLNAPCTTGSRPFRWS